MPTSDRRYAWFRRAIRDLDARFGEVLPKHWRMSQRLCEQFCTLTRTDIEACLCTIAQWSVVGEPHSQGEAVRTRPCSSVHLLLFFAATYSTPDSVPAMSLVKALTKTLQFEKEMRTRFELEEAKAAEAGVAPAASAQRTWLQSLSKEGNLSDSGGLGLGTG